MRARSAARWGPNGKGVLAWALQIPKGSLSVFKDPASELDEFEPGDREVTSTVCALK
jgi:hypothetical protein